MAPVDADVVDDACRKMRPTTPNEVAAMMKNRLCRNKHRTEMKFLRSQVEHEGNQLVKKQIDMEQLMLNIKKTTGKSFVSKTGASLKSNHSRPPSYMENYFDIVRSERNETPGKKAGNTISTQSVRHLPFVRPHSVIERSRKEVAHSVGYYKTDSSSQNNTKRTPNRNIKSAMALRPSTSIGTVKAIEATIEANTPGPALKTNSMPENKEEDKRVIFEDQKLKNIYLEICRQRDAVPRHSKEKIELLKRIDPVFAKRYKEYKSAVISGHAPHFNVNDHNLMYSKKTPKNKIDKQKQGIITLMNTDKYTRPQKIMMQERTEFDRRVKHFVHSLVDLT